MVAVGLKSQGRGYAAGETEDAETKKERCDNFLGTSAPGTAVHHNSYQDQVAGTLAGVML